MLNKCKRKQNEYLKIVAKIKILFIPGLTIFLMLYNDRNLFRNCIQNNLIINVPLNTLKLRGLNPQKT